MNSLRRFAGPTIILAACILAVGCDVAETTKTPSPGEQIADRAEARWQALIEGDVDTAYEFLTPGYRDTMSLEGYRGRFGGAVAWKDADVSDVRVDPESGRAEVILRLEYRAIDATGKVIDMARGLRETWLNENGRWFVSPEG